MTRSNTPKQRASAPGGVAGAAAARGAVASSSSGPGDEPVARHRSGAAARMAGLPVSTLRIWEQRYRVVGPRVTEAGHRLYTEHDVQRLRLLKQLAAAGHAIGSIARSGLAELQALAQQRGLPAAVPARTTAALSDAASGLLPAQASAGPPASPGVPAGAAPPTVVVVGRGLAQRLLSGVMRRPEVVGRVTLVAVHGDLFEAQGQGAALPVALLLVHLASLHAESVERVLAVARRAKAARTCVVYGYGPEHLADALRAGGVMVRRESLTDHELGVLLTAVPIAPVGTGALTGGAALAASSAPAATPPAPLAPLPTPPLRRYADETLIELAAHSATIACECPRHVAELVMQLSGFERYSAECTSRNAADSALHDYLHQVAGTARALFEQALERVALAEGLTLRALASAAARDGG